MGFSYNGICNWSLPPKKILDMQLAPISANKMLHLAPPPPGAYECAIVMHNKSEYRTVGECSIFAI